MTKLISQTSSHLFFKSILCILLGFSLFSVGCKRTSQSISAWTSIDDIEDFISEYPDSAINILENSDFVLIANEEERAKHSLYLSLAKFKAGEDATSDSLLRNAVSYYLNKDNDRPNREVMLTSFLYGHYLMNTDQDSLACLFFDKAARTGFTLQDANYPAMALHAKGILYSKRMQLSIAVKYFQDCLAYLEKHDGALKYKIHTLLSIAQNTNSPSSSHTAKTYIDKAFKLSNDSNINLFIPDLYEELGTYYYYNSDYSNANDAYKYSSTLGQSLTFRDYTFWAESALLANDSIAYELRDIIRNMESFSPSNDLARICMEEAFATHESNFDKVIALRDSIIIACNNTFFPDNDMAFDSVDLAQLESEHKHGDISIWTIAVALICCSIMGVVLWYKFKYNKNEKDNFIVTNNEDLVIESDSSSEPKNDTTNTVISNPIIVSVDKDRFTVNDLYHRYHPYNRWFTKGKDWKNGLSADEIKEATKIKQNIFKLDFIKQVTADIDLAKEGIASSIISEFHIQQNNRIAILLSLCDVEYKAIAFLLDEKPSKVAVTLSRLRDRICNTKSEHSELYRKYVQLK